MLSTIERIKHIFGFHFELLRAVVVLDTRFDAQLISHLIDQSFVKKDNNAVILSLERIFSRKICFFSNLIVYLKEAMWLVIVANFLFTE